MSIADQLRTKAQECDRAEAKVTDKKRDIGRIKEKLDEIQTEFDRETDKLHDLEREVAKLILQRQNLEQAEQKERSKS